MRASSLIVPGAASTWKIPSLPSWAKPLCRGRAARQRTVALAAGAMILLFPAFSHARNIPQTNQLLFANLSSAFPSNGYQGNWSCYVPAGSNLTAIGSPTVEPIAGMPYAMNLRAEGDGYRQGYYPNASSPATGIPCNGVSVIAVVVPTRTTGADAWNHVVDAMYDRIGLGVYNNSGLIRVSRQGVSYNSTYAIPDRQMTILSLVVQPNGPFKVWVNGSNVMDVAATATVTSLYPSASDSYRKYINVGRNNPDSWTAFNGDIGDVFFYTNALSDADRQMLEADLQTNFFSLARTVALPASDLSPAGATLNGKLLSAGLAGGNAGVWACYGTVDGGLTTGGWQNAVLVSNSVPTGLFSRAVGGLTSGATYVYRFYATNAYGGSWSDYPARVGIPALPSISNEVPRSVRVTTARARGYLVSSNNAPTCVQLYHGAADGGTDPGGWEASIDLGLREVGQLDTLLTGITGVRYYRYCASNMAGVAWAGSANAVTSAPPYDPLTNGYTRQMPMTITNYAGAEALADFPFLVQLSETSSGFRYANLLSFSNDIRFTASDGSELCYEIDTWKTNGNSLVWVEVPVVTNRAVLYMSFGKAGDAVPACATNGSAWWHDYVGVWHMSRKFSPNARGIPAYDITSGSNPELITNAVGLVGTCQDFNQPGYLYAGDVDLPPSGFTFSFWSFRRGQGSTGDQWCNVKNGSYGIWNQYGDWRVFINAWNSGSAGFASTDRVWTHVAGTYDGRALRIYKNGALADTATSTGMVVNNNQLLIGQSFYGMLDEVRAQSVVRSADWLKAEYSNQVAPAAMVVYGAVTSAPAPLRVLAPTNVTVDSACLNGDVALSDGNTACVWVYWGTNDGGKVKTAWKEVASLGTRSAGPFSTCATGLAGSTVYYYQAYASNLVGEAWADSATNFTTLHPDSDSDGILDRWEMTHFGNLTTADTTSDYDHDGLSDRDEFLAGTVPTNSASVFALTDCRQDASNGIVLGWYSVDGRLYSINQSTNLVVGIWDTAFSNIVAVPPMNVFTLSPGSAAMFYRVNVTTN